MGKLSESFEVSTERELLRNAGSFWRTYTKDTQVVTQLVKLNTTLKLWNQFEGICYNVLGIPMRKVQQVFEKFQFNQVEYTSIQPLSDSLPLDLTLRSIQLSDKTSLSYWLQNVSSALIGTSLKVGFSRITERFFGLIIQTSEISTGLNSFVVPYIGQSPTGSEPRAEFMVGSLTVNGAISKFTSEVANVINNSSRFRFKLYDNKLLLGYQGTAALASYRPLVFDTGIETLIESEVETIATPDVAVDDYWVQQFNSMMFNLKIVESGGYYYLAFVDINSDNNLAYPVFTSDVTNMIEIGEPMVYASAGNIKPSEFSAYDFNKGSIYYYRIECGAVKPISIQSQKGKLVINQDFYVVGNNIFFVDNPILLFPNGKYLIEHGITHEKSVYDFPLRAPSLGVKGTDTRVAKYAKVNQTPKGLEFALAEVGGLKILKQDAVLIDRQVVPSGEVRYTFDTETHYVGYPHVYLQVGERFTANTIIGGGVKVFNRDPKNSSWWKQIPFGDGFNLGAITKHKTLIVPNREVIAFISGVTDTLVHSAFDLDGSVQDKLAFWNEVASRETETHNMELILQLQDLPSFDLLTAASEFTSLLGQFNASMSQAYATESGDVYKAFSTLNLSGLSATKDVNPIDVLFESILGITGVVIVVDINQILDWNNFQKYLTQEIPTGCTPLILITGFATSDEYSFDTHALESYIVNYAN